MAGTPRGPFVINLLRWRSFRSSRRRRISCSLAAVTPRIAATPVVQWLGGRCSTGAGRTVAEHPHWPAARRPLNAQSRTFCAVTAHYPGRGLAVMMAYSHGGSLRPCDGPTTTISCGLTRRRLIHRTGGSWRLATARPQVAIAGWPSRASELRRDFSEHFVATTHSTSRGGWLTADRRFLF